MLLAYKLCLNNQLLCNICSWSRMLHSISMSSNLRNDCTELNLKFWEIAHLVEPVSSDILVALLCFFLVWWVIGSRMLRSWAFGGWCFMRIRTYLLILFGFKHLNLLLEKHYGSLKVISTFLKHLQPLITCRHVVCKSDIIIIQSRNFVLSHIQLRFFQHLTILIGNILRLFEALDSILGLILIIHHFEGLLV